MFVVARKLTAWRRFL